MSLRTGLIEFLRFLLYIPAVVFLGLWPVGVVHANRYHGEGDGKAALYVIPFGIYRGAESFWHKDPAPRPALNERYRRFVDRAREDHQRRDPEARLVKDVFDSLDRAKRVDVGDGLYRVPDTTLMRFVAGEANLLAALPVEVCGKGLARDAEEESIQAAYGAMDSTVLDGFARALVSAVVAEEQQSAFVPLDSAATDSARRSIDTALGPVQAHRLSSVFAKPRPASGEDKCWAKRTITYQMTMLPPHQGASFMRALAHSVPNP